MKTHTLLFLGAMGVLTTAAYAIGLRERLSPQPASDVARLVAAPAAQGVKEARSKDAQAKGIEWEPSFEAALEKAKAENKLVMVDFHAEWCGACHMMDAKTFPDAAVVAGSRRFVNVKVDVDKQSALAARYGARSLPTIGWIRGDGSPVGGIVGAYPPKYFVMAMDAAQKRADERAAQSGKDKL